ncbi:MAG: IS21-like element helper ATPase IstB [Candidatus Eiseniibacteriota bacterium]
MLTEPTVEKLRTLHLDAMAQGYLEQTQKPDIAELPFNDRFGLLVDAEYLARENKRLSRRLREAKLRLTQACVEDVDYAPKRELDKATFRQLATCRWVQEHLNVLITGSAGTGKSYLACALANRACRQGYRALYCRASRLFDELLLARATGTHLRLLAKLARMDVLVIDDWGLKPFTDQERLDLLEILEDRYGSRSTIITSQLAPNKWHERLGEPTIADAILDRLLHGAYKIALKGPSKRKEEVAEP